MADDAAVVSEQDASLPEQASAPPPVALKLHWAYEQDGLAPQQADALVTVGQDELDFTCDSRPRFTVRYNDIAAIEDQDLDLVLSLRDGGAFRLSRMARLRDQFRGALMEKWQHVNRRQALSEEKQLASFTGTAGNSLRPAAACDIGVYSTAVVLSFEDGLVARLPLVYTGRPEEGDYAFTFRLPKDCWTVSRLGRDSDRFRQAVQDAVTALEAQALERLVKLCPGIPSFTLGGIAGWFMDGMAVSAARVRTVLPGCADALVAALGDAGLGPAWEALCPLGEAGQARIGRKLGLWGESSVYTWFFLPVVRDGRANLVMESSADGGNGRATYVFHVPGGAQAVETAMDELNYGLIMLNFRREPIYMTPAQLEKPENEVYRHSLRRLPEQPENEVYRHSLRRLPELVRIRECFVGRVAHTTPQAWLDGVRRLLDQVPG